MRYKNLESALLCALVTFLVASSASAQEQRTASIDRSHQAVASTAVVTKYTVKNGGTLEGAPNDIVLNPENGKFTVTWQSRELRCSGSRIHPDLQSRFTYPSGAVVNCYVPSSNSPEYDSTVIGVAATMRAPVNRTGLVFAYRDSRGETHGDTYNLTTGEPSATEEYVDDKVEEIDARNSRRFALSAGYNPYFTRRDTHGLNVQFGGALVDPEDSVIFPELGVYLAWASTHIGVSNSWLNVTVDDEDARMYTYTFAPLINGVVSMCDAEGDWICQFVFGAAPGVRVNSTVKEVVAQLPDGSVVMDDQVTRYGFAGVARVGFRLGWKVFFLNPDLVGEVAEEPLVSGADLDTKYRSNLLMNVAGGITW